VSFIISYVLWVHKHINIMKNEYTTAHFVELCRGVVDYYDKNRAK